ncbi:982_t:CDS:2 [Funneliformis geosporum]|uniref:995_t:CDS:1 n=1 Tax=Funneliformis geosporum TaxID=1117311 RepID=A0A9W4SQM7_9GLOM|nr:982_t:CDS:2 [Funneliformis geosporum]CAI2178037.1 995_t:CDS:2 [Funneliformis geosporum]
MSPPSSIELQTLTNLYQRAKHAFLLRKYDSSHLLCSSAISKLLDLSPVPSPSIKILQTKIWNLYINLVAAILAERSPVVTQDLEIKRLLERSPEKVVNDVWLKVINEGYAEEIGEVPGEVVVACILFCLNQREALNGRNIIEEWFNALSDELILHLEHMSSKHVTSDPILNSYEKVVELYLLQVLPKLKDWDLASKFLADNEIINKDRKKAYEQTLLKLKERTNKPTPLKYTKPKKDKSKREEGNGHHISSILNVRSNYIFTNGMEILTNNQKYGSSSSPSSNMMTCNNGQFTRSLHSGTRTTATVTSSRNIVDNRPSTVNRIVSNRIMEYLMLYLQRMMSKMSAPGFLFFIMILFVFSTRSNIKKKLHDAFYKWLAKLWQTLKAATYI